MNDAKNHSRLEELASLHAVDLLSEAERKELFEAAQANPAANLLVREFAETAALLAYEAPQIKPPPDLKREILDQLPARNSKSKIIPFRALIPFAIAAALMLLGIYQLKQIMALKSELVATRADAARLRESNTFIGLRLATLEAKDAAQNVVYASSKIMVAWDPYQHRGVVSMENLPAPPPGHDYQLWVLDPEAPAPVSAGVISASGPFSARPIGTPAPGFAISLEPSGGSPLPTGPILFAVAPGA